MDRRKLSWLFIAAAGAFIHVGTAVLRLSTFFPYPRLLDFSGFYASAWAMRLGLEPYDVPATLIERLRSTAGLSLRPPPIFNPPIWPCVLQPFTALRFPAAAWAWLLVNGALILWSTHALAQVAGVTGRRARVATLIAVITFGPVFLDLTLGQTSTLLLAMALVVGRALPRHAPRSDVAGALAVALATGAKLYPLVWLGGLFPLRRWRLVSLAFLATAIGFGLVYVAAPAANQAYWFDQLPARVTRATERASVDDQSLVAWLDRMGRAQQFGTSGLTVTEDQPVTWDPPWEISAATLRWAGYSLLAVLALAVLSAIWRSGPAQIEGAFYLWLLFTLLLFPHTERYNHTLILPAMAWLWGRNERGRVVVAVAYGLAGLSRLTHAWVLLLPAPWAPLATGFGIMAVLLLTAGMMYDLRGARLPRIF